MQEVASAFKVAYHREKLKDYLLGERIFPATLELDITTECTRDCRDCPSSRSHSHQYVDLEFVRKLFASLEGRTKGLLVAGGEPTMSRDFAVILKMAREMGFEEIAVVSNGGLLHRERVAEALLSYATSVRVSLYDWDTMSCGGITATLEGIESLRERIGESDGRLEIGVSALTSRERVPALPTVADAARRAGADWVYFHPMCVGWGEGCPDRVGQSGVLQAIEEYRKSVTNGFGVYVAARRYLDTALSFDAYHAAHFLLVIGADGINYVGAEAKYQPHLALADVAGDWRPEFLWRDERLSRIEAMNSRNYAGVGSRHRGILYSSFIEGLRNDSRSLDDGSLDIPEGGFRHPHIL